MSANVLKWLSFADENLEVARLSMRGGYYNACLQNIQQAVEKYLKAVLLGKNGCAKRTHSIEALVLELQGSGVEKLLAIDECELFDSLYIPSKYPVGTALPDFVPDEAICRQCLEIAERVKLFGHQTS